MIRWLGFAGLAAAILLTPAMMSSQSTDSESAVAAGSSFTPGCESFLDGRYAAGGADAAADESGKNGFSLANLDRAASPCDDFFRFADGGWAKDNPIPADKARWSTFDELQNHNDEALHQILEEAAKDTHANQGSNWQKIGDFYASCMNEPQIEIVGLKPLQPELQGIAEIKDTATLEAQIARLHRTGLDLLFQFGSEQDLKDNTHVIASAGQGGLALPDRQYYVDDDERSKEIRAAYVQHVTKMFKLTGDDDKTAADEANTVLNVETSLARASKKREDLRDPDANYHKMSLGQLHDLTPHFSWTSYLQGVGAGEIRSVDIGQPEFFKQVDADLSAVPLADWKVYLRWHVIHDVVRALPAKFVEENFNFYGRTLTGTKQILPRWHRCTYAVDDELGEALGQYYVKRFFPPEAKAAALTMVKNIVAALHDDLETLDWMGPATREQALKKLAAMNLKVGYPDKWRDYSAYNVDRGSYVENLLRGDTFENARDLAKIGKPVDRSEWHMTTPSVNAYHSSLMNEIVFPAGILQPPFFNPHADDAINYGGIGSVIGHEMTHGFDDHGAKFDADGNLHNWWTPEDLKNFQARGECIEKQFSSYEVEPGLHGNGKLEEGESIADLGGMTISHAAFEKTQEAKSGASIDGFTPEQRFFLGWAQIWAGHARPEYERLIAKTNEHPLNRFRVTGALSNTGAFAKAFNCGANSKMMRPEDQRCRIW